MTSGPSDALLLPLPQDVPLFSTATRVLIAVAAPVQRPPLTCRRHLAGPQELGHGRQGVEEKVSHRTATITVTTAATAATAVNSNMRLRFLVSVSTGPERAVSFSQNFKRISPSYAFSPRSRR